MDDTFKSRKLEKIEAELIYLAWEGAILFEFVMKLVERHPRREVIVIENKSYGIIALSPIKRELEKHTTIWSKYMRSSEAHKNHTVYSETMFSESELESLSCSPVVVVVDGSYSLDEEKQISLGREPGREKFPDAHHWYVNFLCKRTETSPIKSTFSPKYWHAGELKIGINYSNGHVPLPTNLNFTNSESTTSYQQSLILTQTCIEDSAIPKKVKEEANFIKHSPGFFDFPPKEHNLFLSEQGNVYNRQKVQELFETKFLNNIFHWL